LHQHAQGIRFEVGRLEGGRCRIALGLVGKGNQSAAVLAERAIHRSQGSAPATSPSPDFRT
jgi:8-oxo-dGTP diphosphatase